MRILASDLVTLHSPSRCALRIYLVHHGVPGAPPGAFQELLFRFGQRHEQAHLATLGAFVDLRGGTPAQRQQRTRACVAERAALLYQPALQQELEINGVRCEVAGDPDFLIAAEGGYRVRDAKLARRITEGEHPEIFAQLNLYAWLFERSFGAPPLRLEVVSGGGELVELPYAGEKRVLGWLSELAAIKDAAGEPDCPVGWGKCSGCAYQQRCWERAEARRDVARVAGLDEGLARALRAEGISTVDGFLARFDEVRLARFGRPRGTRTVKVGKVAARLLRQARAQATGRAQWLRTPAIPEAASFVMFDLEGIPPLLDETGNIYLWGTQVFGAAAGDYQAALAGFGPNGDREGWQTFLDHAQAIFAAHGDIPFVHWADYEKSQLRLYLARYGDRDGIAARVEENLLDLLGVTRASVALPLPSYSLKVVEDFIGFERSQSEYGGEWSMARFIEATETGDAAQRDTIMDEILQYNREDLEATWAVLAWLRAGARETPRTP
jgi:predicted RecB family nuclease